jgi:hypothetical protein
VITRLAAEYDITVVGAHDQYTRSKPGLGPVASRVVAAAPGAVLIGRELGEEGWGKSRASWREITQRGSKRRMNIMKPMYPDSHLSARATVFNSVSAS